MTKRFRVIWQIDVEAETHEQAAQLAWDMRNGEDSTANMFTVKERKEYESSYTFIHPRKIDLSKGRKEEVQP